MNIFKATVDFERWLAKRLPIVRQDIALKHQHMAEAAFPFFRATFYRWLQLWPEVCPELANAPTMLELAKTDADRAALTMMFARTEYGRPYFAPPDVPPARIEALRRAFDATMHDPDFVTDAAQLQLELSPMRGEGLQALVAKLARTPPEIVARVRAALEGP